MVVQFHRLGFPPPNGILPLYEVPFAKLFKKVDPLHALAKQLSEKLQVPLKIQGETILVVQDQLSAEVELDYQELKARGVKKIFLLGLTGSH